MLAAVHLIYFMNCLLCVAVRRAILAAIIVTSLFNYIPLLQLRNARVTRPSLCEGAGGARLTVIGIAVLPYQNITHIQGYTYTVKVQ